MASALRIGSLLVVCVVLALIAGTWWAHVRPARAVPVDAALVAHARAAIPALPIVEPLEGQDYDRTFFGPAWQSPEATGCDTRNEVLGRWLNEVRLAEGQGCSVVSGWFIDPYTGHYIEYQRGPETSVEVQIDHVVSLADAWRKGAAGWDRARAQAFANDPLNLVPTQDWVNREKGALDASQWLPHHEGFWCHFAVQQILVKEKYGLGVSDAELGELSRALEACE